MTTPQPTLDWQGWLCRWDAQQTGYIPDREERFTAMLDVLELLLPARFVALDLACGPGAVSQRVLARFPAARCVALDVDPVLLALGQGALGDYGGRLRWVEADLRHDTWIDQISGLSFDAVLSATALHWLRDAPLARVYTQVARVLRPGGVLLNGDHMRFGAQLPTIERVAATITTRDSAAAAARTGGEDWRMWWDALAAEPAMQELLAERARRFPEATHDEHAPTAATHAAALRAAGFREVDAIWQRWESRVLMAVR